MKDATMLSVIVPGRNAGATIGAALDSLIAASAPLAGPMEVILIDGGSTDDTIAQAEARRPALPGLRILHQDTQGLAAARNEALACASGQLIAFCDADDRWTRDAIRLRMEALRLQPDSWAATGQVYFVAVEGNASAAPVRRIEGAEHPGFTPGAMLIRRHAFQSVGTFDATLHIGADADWILRATQTLGPPHILSQVVLEKGLRPGSLSTDVATYRAEMMLIARRFIARKRGGGR